MGHSIALFGGAAKPFHRLVIVPRHTAPVGIAQAHERLGAGIALLGQRTRQPQGRFILAFFVGRIRRVDGVDRLGGAKPGNPCRNGLFDRPSIGDDHENYEQNDGRDGCHEPVFAPLRDRLAGDERRLKTRHLLLQVFRFRWCLLWMLKRPHSLTLSIGPGHFFVTKILHNPGAGRTCAAVAGASR